MSPPREPTRRSATLRGFGLPLPQLTGRVASPYGHLAGEGCTTKSMPSQHDHRSPQLAEVESMSLAERQAAISAGVIEDLSEAPKDVRAFAASASSRYLATFVD